MNYKVGDTVVCIDATGKKTLQLGATYVVAWIGRGSCCGGALSIRTQSEAKCIWRCRVCNRGGIPYELDGHGAWRFIKLPKVTARTEVTSEAEAI